MKEYLKLYRGWLGIGLAALALVIWVTTGEAPADRDLPASGPEPVRVLLEPSRARPVEEVVRLQGHVEPHQRVQVRAKTTGEVVETPVTEGAVVEEGQLIARLAMDDREARLQEARAALSRAQGDYEAARQLADRGLQAGLETERARADLEAARARVATIELDIRHTRVRSPIDGVLNTLEARRGDYVTESNPVAEIVENNPLRAVVHIPQHRVGAIEKRQSARVRFLDERVREGSVTYLSTTADPDTRTFLARVRVDNPGRDLPAGTSVTVEIPISTRHAHAVSPALVSLGEGGELGVKVGVREQGQWRARFLPVEPIRADARKLWVAGLPDEIRLITRGQGFVRDGDLIAPVEQSDT